MSVPFKLPLREIQIHLEWTDGYGPTKKTFGSVQEFARFLTENPQLANAIGYVPKRKEVTK